MRPRLGLLREGGELSSAGYAEASEATPFPATAFRASGWSMFPAIHKGDWLELVAAEPLAPGELVVFRQGDEFVCHRLKELREGGLALTRGDNSSSEDPPIARAAILGKVSAVRRGAKRLDFPETRAPGAWPRFRMRASRAWEPIEKGAWLRARRRLIQLKKIPAFRKLLSSALLPLCRFELALRVPLKSIEAYAFDEPGPDSREKIEAAGDWALVARLFGRIVGRRYGGSGRLEINELVAGLGIEERLEKLAAGLS